MDKKKNILIVDDAGNLSILDSMLSAQYDIIEAKNGKQAISILNQSSQDISLIFMDVEMQEMNGIQCLKRMKQKGWVNTIPIIMISGDVQPKKIEQVFDLGAVDFMCTPLDPQRVLHRTMVYIEVAESEKKLESLGGEHVFHIQKITKVILDRLKQKHSEVKITQQEEHLICQAASLHDIGKLAIPEEILNKPGKLTTDEFEVIKKHPEEGVKILNHLTDADTDPLLLLACEITHWHHERYDGKGYPDGLKGDEIPFAAQVVALADVYEALCSKRVYKDAYPKDKAIQMIKNGECGAFNPMLLDCLGE
jgi:putative two-component system response regulator